MGRQLAVFTMVHREPLNLARWLEHYLSHGVDPRDMYVLSHSPLGDTGPELEDLCRANRINYLVLEHDLVYDTLWLPNTVNLFQRFLLGSYEWVVFSAADELVFPADGDLSAYFQERPRGGVIVCQGSELVSRPADPPLLHGTRLLAQRQQLYNCQRYTKILAVSTHLDYSYGFQAWCPASESLFVLHYHKADYKMALERHRHLSREKWFPETRDRIGNPYRHNLMFDPEMVQRWLLSDADDTSRYADLQVAPDWLVSQVRG